MDDDTLFPHDDPRDLTGPGAGGASGDAGRDERANEGKRSIRYVARTVLEFGRVSGLADLLDRVSALCVSTGYSPFNALLILLQRPGARYVLPAHQWQHRFGQVVRPGEQPLVLLQRGGPLMFLFEASQVEPGPGAAELPLGLADPWGMRPVVGAEGALHWVVDNARYDGVRVTAAPLGRGFAGCVRPSSAGAVQPVQVRRRPEEVVEDVPVRFDVELNRTASPTEQLATLAHELGHVYCGHLGPDVRGHWKDRTLVDDRQREVEAESVARVVFASIAPGVALPDPMRLFFDPAPGLDELDLETVLKAAGRVLEIASGWGPRWSSSPDPR